MVECHHAISIPQQCLDLVTHDVSSICNVIMLHPTYIATIWQRTAQDRVIWRRHARPTTGHKGCPMMMMMMMVYIVYIQQMCPLPILHPSYYGIHRYSWRTNYGIPGQSIPLTAPNLGVHCPYIHPHACSQMHTHTNTAQTY